MRPRIETNTTPSGLLQEDLLWGAPKTSDTEFLVLMRARLTAQPMGFWLTSRKTAMAFGLAALLLVGVWYPGQSSGSRYSTEMSSLDATVDEFAFDESDPSELADYLGVTADFEATSIENGVSFTGVSIAELLELEPQELDTILSELQEINFF